MASIKIKFKPSSVPGDEGMVYYQIIHDRKVRQLMSGHKVFPSEWDDRRSTVTIPDNDGRTPLLLSISERIRWDVERLGIIARKMEAGAVAFTAEDIIHKFNESVMQYSLFNFMELLIARFKQQGRTRTSEAYTAALRSFRKFRKNEDIMLDRLTADVMESYGAWLAIQGLTANTVSFYARIIRATYRRAVNQGMIDDCNPFRYIYTGVDRTVKRALPLEVIRKIKALDLSLCPSADLARDMFIMSFYLRGMSFIDMAFLEKSALNNGYITYRRRKTGQQLVIAWTREMQVILEKYPANKSDYLLPIIRDPGVNERRTYHNMGYNINRHLKKIGEMAGVGIPLTLYVARHSWATAAKAKGIPVSVISEGLGHDSEATTMIYLSSLDTSVVDKANAIVISSI